MRRSKRPYQFRAESRYSLRKESAEVLALKKSPSEGLAQGSYLVVLKSKDGILKQTKLNVVR